MVWPRQQKQEVNCGLIVKDYALEWMVKNEKEKNHEKDKKLGCRVILEFIKRVRSL